MAAKINASMWLLDILFQELRMGEKDVNKKEQDKYRYRFLKC